MGKKYSGEREHFQFYPPERLSDESFAIDNALYTCDI